MFSGLVVALGQDGLFQNKIISMPQFPPNARREMIVVGGVDGTQISVCVASVNCGVEPSTTVYILYFQEELSPVSLSLSSCSLYLAGNTSSIPPRLPVLPYVLRMVRE
jgi:hypothetical protein